MRQSGVVWVLDGENSPELIERLRSHARGIELALVWTGEGWRPLVEECHRNLEEAFPDYELLNVKEKYGVLEFQALAHPWKGRGSSTADEWDRMRAITGAVRSASEETCEWCGSPGLLRDGRTYWLTLCDTCHHRFADPPWDRGFRGVR